MSIRIAAIALTSAVVLSGWIWTASDGERERICHPGYAKSQRLPFHEYVLTRNQAFRRAGIPLDRQCKHHQDNGSSTGEEHGECYVLDHIVPLCLGGTNSLDNLQVQPRQDAEDKDVVEVETCRAYCRHAISHEDAVKRFGRAWK